MNIIACNEHNICVDGYGPPESRDFDASVAYCVSTQNFVNIAKSKSDPIANSTFRADISSKWSAGISEITTATEGLGIEAVPTEPDQKSSVYVKQMHIEAQTCYGAYSTFPWHSLPDGFGTCRYCSSLDLKQVPNGTKGVKSDIMLSGLALATGGVLYLFRTTSQKHP